MKKSMHRLAWHETLELHELTAFQSNTLIQLKKTIGKIADPELKHLYHKAIKGIENNLRELLQFYSYEPYPVRAEWDSRDADSGFYAGSLLGFAKSAVKNYAAAITETVTPALRQTFVNHLLNAIDLHYKVFGYMYQHGYYPAYDLEQLRVADVKNAEKALSM